MSTLRIIASSIAVMVVGLGATTCSADFVNGNFELAPNLPGLDAPGFTDWDGWTEIAGTGPPVGWVEGVNFGGVEVPDSGDGGTVVVNLGALNAIEQELVTTAGTTYNLSYYLGGLGGAFSPEWIATLEVTANGTVIDTQNVSQTAGGAGFFNQVTTSFVATGATTTIRFANTVDNTPDDFGIVLDNVSATAIPEPSTAFVLGGALLGVSIRRRKR